MKGGGVMILLVLLSCIASSSAIVTLPFHYSFTANGTLNEAGSLLASTSPYWWLNSGGKLVLQNGIGKTVRGALPEQDYWRIAYSLANPEDTDDGYHPQNIFRLLTKTKLPNTET